MRIETAAADQTALRPKFFMEEVLEEPQDCDPLLPCVAFDRREIESIATTFWFECPGLA